MTMSLRSLADEEVIQRGDIIQTSEADRIREITENNLNGVLIGMCAAEARIWPFIQDILRPTV